MSALLYDSNLWVALTFAAHPHHGRSVEKFASASAESPACFYRATQQQSFSRLATTPALLRAYQADGFNHLDAVDLHATLIRQPSIRVLPEPPELETLWLRLAAFAIRQEVEFVTLDRDFKKFEKDGLKLQFLGQ